MPEKPKRRKNNKNKRKNKNNNWQSSNNKNSSDLKSNSEQCSESGPSDGKDNNVSELNHVCANESAGEMEKQVKCDSGIKSQNLIDHIIKDENTPQIEVQGSTEDSSISITPKLQNNTDKNVNIEVTNDKLSPSKEIVLSNSSSFKELQEIRDASEGAFCPVVDYVVESPEQSKEIKPKLVKTVKSKSLDNDEDPNIVEITEDNTLADEDSLAIVDCSNVLVTDVESDVEWETANVLQENIKPKSKEIATGKLSVTCIPLTVAQCDQTKSLTPDEERDLRMYLDTLNLSTHAPSALEIKTEIEEIINREVRHRLRKKGFTDDFLSPKVCPTRYLDVIDEEGSGESSLASRRHSVLSEKKSDIDDLDDDVFEDKTATNAKCVAMQTKAIKNTVVKKGIGRHIPQQCILVDAKLKEPEVSEARGDWTMQTVEKVTGAEVVYLTDSSSNTSSVYDLREETDDGVETDVSVRMITPTIEVTDTENLLKETFIRENENNLTGNINTQNVEKDKYETNVITKDSAVKSENPGLNSHEIIVLSTDNIKTNLYVKDLDEKDNTNIETEQKTKINETEFDNTCPNNSTCNYDTQKSKDNFDLEMKVLKCELNDAINNLIKEVSDSESVTEKDNKGGFNRQDSSSSIGSSQCTAKYNPSASSLNDVSNILHDELNETTKSTSEHLHCAKAIGHVKDVFECVAGSTTLNKGQVQGFDNQPLPLRDICVKKVARFPYGDKILQELASVSEKLQHITIFGINAKNDAIDEEQKQFAIGSNKSHTENMPYYPLPDVSSIEKVSLPTKPKDSVPPPIKPRKSSLKKNDDALWTGVPTKQEPVYLCLSPSQKMLMEKTNTVITKEDATQLVDMHTKFVDRRGYNEYYDNKDKTQDKERVDMPSAVPFKSQTGSRLLAIIRDPAVTNNISSSMNKHYNKSLDQLQSKYSQSESTFKKNVERFNSSKVAHSFKPIPPPRPRKFSSSLYESDESSDFTDSSLRSIKSERKFFHYSTGALNKEIENDISSIQDMHRRYTNTRDQLLKPASNQNTPRRPSLPQDLCDQQMEYIRQKEKEVEAEIRRLEEMKLNIVESKKGSPKAPVISEKEVIEEKHFDADNYSISRKRDVAFLRGKSPDKEKSEKSKVSSAFSSSQEEIQREKMYSEYMNQMAERQERKQHKIIKITNPSAKQSSSSTSISKSMSSLEVLEAKTNNPIEKEFIWKARERWNKLGIKDPETEDEKEDSKLVYREPQVIEHKIKVIEGGEEKDVQKLPNHLQEFVKLTAKKEGTGSPGESRAGPTAPHAVILCAVLILLIAVVKFFFRLLRNKN